MIPVLTLITIDFARRAGAVTVEVVRGTLTGVRSAASQMKSGVVHLFAHATPDGSQILLENSTALYTLHPDVAFEVAFAACLRRRVWV